MTSSHPLAKFHPLAKKFPLLNGAEFRELVEDVRKHGLREPIVMHEGAIIDGRNRYRACLQAKVEPTYREFDPSKEGDPIAFVFSANVHRRHLKAKEKRELLVKLVAAAPEKSDRMLAEEAKVDHKQISRARAKAEATGAVAPVERHIGKDGKSRRQPAHRPPVKKLPKAAKTEVGTSVTSVTPPTTTEVQDRLDDLHRQHGERPCACPNCVIRVPQIERPRPTTDADTAASAIRIAYTDAPKDIAATLVGKFSSAKARAIAAEVLALLDRKPEVVAGGAGRTVTSQPSQEQ
jgi:hypothetical protein